MIHVGSDWDREAMACWHVLRLSESRLVFLAMLMGSRQEADRWYLCSLPGNGMVSLAANMVCKVLPDMIWDSGVGGMFSRQ